MKSLFSDSIHTDQQVWMIDEYRMDRIELENFFVSDHFSEPGYSHGQSRVYFWQHRKEKFCTIKVHATVTDSNKHARELLNLFLSYIPNQDAMKRLPINSTDYEWFKNTEAENVYTFHPDNSDTYMVFLVWGNIFFHIESIGEKDHSIYKLLKDLGSVWVDRKKDTEKKPEFSLFTDNTELRFGQELSLIKRGQSNLQDYYAFLYVAGPKDLVTLFRSNGVMKLKATPPRKGSQKRSIIPHAQLIGLCPDGQFVEGERLEFSVDQGGG